MELERVRAFVAEKARGERVPPGAYLQLASAYLWFGKTVEAETLIRDIEAEKSRAIGMMRLYDARGDLESFRRTYLEIERDPWPLLSPDSLVRLGLMDEARRIVANPDSHPWPWPHAVAVELGLGEAALARSEGRVEDAIDGYKKWRSVLKAPRIYLQATRDLAETYRSSGDLEEAAAQLEDALSLLDELGPNAGSTWLTIELNLIHVSRELGRADRAAALENDLRQRLGCADPDFAVLRFLDEGYRWE